MRPLAFLYIACLFSLCLLHAPGKAWAMPAPLTVPNSHGVSAQLIQDASVPVASIVIYMAGGSHRDAPEQAGRSNLGTALLLEGAGDLEALAFKKALEDQAIRFNASVGKDHMTLTLQSLTEHLDDAVRLSNLALTNPRFDEEALTRLKQQTYSYIDFQQQQPSTLADQAWWQKIFPDHPYAQVVFGTKETVAALTREDILAWYAASWHRDDIFIGLAGNLSRDQASAIVNDLFANFRFADTQNVVPPANLPPKAQAIHIDRAIPQTVFVFGQAGLERSDPQYYAGMILNYVLGGGGFSSRLMQEIREKRGLTYGVYTHQMPMLAAPLLRGQLSTSGDKATEAWSLVQEIWQDTKDNGLTPEEVAHAKSYLNGSFAISQDSTLSMARTLAAVQYFDLPDDYITNRAQLINAVSVQEVNALASELLSDQGLYLITVGPQAP